MKLRNSRFAVAGDGLVVVIIFLALIGGGIWWLYAHKSAMDKEGRLFAKTAVEALTIRHDPAFFAANLGPQARLENPPSVQVEKISQFTQMGVPAQPINIDEKMVWESQFFEPRGYFTAHLNYPARSATLQIAISHPVGKWQLDNVSFEPQKER